MKTEIAPNAIIAQAIRREREAAGLTLSALAAEAGLAKSTLSQLEAGKGNPNVETLWAIATALGIPFSCLFEGASDTSELIRASEGTGFVSQAPGYSAVLLDKSPPNRRRDLYRMKMTPGSVRTAAAHPRGTIEHAMVLEGHIRLGPVAGLIELSPGDYFRFAGDVPHSYEALAGPTLVMLVMDSPR